MRHTTHLALFLLVLVPFVGCSAEYSESGSKPSAAPPPAAARQPVDSVRLAAVLTAADRVDGAEDKIVAKCSGCALHMDGSADHTLEVEGYELHFCSETCRDGFAEDPAGKLVAMELPEQP